MQKFKLATPSERDFFAQYCPTIQQAQKYCDLRGRLCYLCDGSETYGNGEEVQYTQLLEEGTHYLIGTEFHGVRYFRAYPPYWRREFRSQLSRHASIYDLAQVSLL
jgi:hypothetical protein